MRKSLGKFGWVQIPPQLSKRGWLRLLQTWAQLIERFDSSEETQRPLKDVAYWYGERALTGLLAAAAWKSPGWWALEEFTGKRYVDPRLKSKRTGSVGARGDLWLGLHVHRGSWTQYCYTIEAKQSWTGRHAEAILTAIETQLGKAKMQLRRLDPVFRWGYPMAVCFHIPAIHTKTAIAWNAPKVFAEVADALRNRSNTIIAAVWRSHSKVPRDGPWSFPGVLFVGEVYRTLHGGKGLPKAWKGKLER